MRKNLLAIVFMALFVLGPLMSASWNPPPILTREGRSACVEAKLFLRVPWPKKGGLSTAAAKYTGSASNRPDIEKYNPEAKRHRTSSVRIPVELLLPAYRIEALSALLPEDKGTPSGWEHTWGTSPLGEHETWEDLALWFAGNRKQARALREANRNAGRRPKVGTVVRVPEALLLPAYKSLAAPPPPGPGLPPVPGEEKKPQAPAKPTKEEGTFVGPPQPPQPAPAPPFIGPPLPPQEPPEAPPQAIPPEIPAALPLSAPSPLTYGKDAQGAYAIYRLQAHEALYSAVVVRFTGNVDADDVNALALEYAKRSGITDVHAIPVGYPVKIPLDDLLPQYLPSRDPRYEAWEKKQAEVGQITNTYKNSALEGVVVILDSGHGGLDRGAMKNGVWEDSYVYDIVCRIHEGLARRTKALVLMTLLNPDLGYRPQEKTKLTPNTGAVILTHPWFQQESKEETKVEVNLRWCLANQYYLRLQKEGADSHRVLFTSVHADSLHPSLRGTMFYIPGTDYRQDKWCLGGEDYMPYQEVVRQPCYSLTEKEMTRSEGLSLQLAKDLERSFSAHNLMLHPYNTTRNHVIRGRRSWVPAVLRNSIVPCSILIEVCNLNNEKDAELIAKPSFRQAVADAYIDALIRYYS